MKKPMLIVCSVVLMLMVIAAGCGTNNNAGNNSSSSPGGSAGTTPGNSGGQAGADAEPIKIRFLKPGSPGDSPEIPRIKAAIEESFYAYSGIRIDLDLYYYDWDVIDQRFNLDITSGNAPDMVRLDVNRFFKYYSSGFFQPVDDLIAAHTPNLAKRFSEGELNAAKYKGEMAGFPLSGYPVNYALVAREDKLQELGLSAPTTLEQLENVMDAYKKARPDEYPLSGIWFGTLRVMNALAGINTFAGNSRSLVMNSDGTVTSYFMHENMDKYMDLASRWYSNGWLSPDFMTVGDEAEGLFVKDSGLIVALYATSGVEAVDQTRSTVNPKAAATVLPSLQTPWSWGNQTSYFEGYNSEGYIGIPKTVSAEKAEVIAKLINWELENPDNFWLTKKGVRGEDYEVVDGKMVMADKWQAEGANPYSWEHWMINRPVVNGGDLLIPSADEVDGIEKAYDYLKNAKFIEDPMLKAPYLPLGDLAAKVDALNQKLGFLQTEIILGKKPLSAWSEAAKIWADGGGADIEKQATEIYKSLAE